ncbi:hypothetical protein TPAR_08750 [Tolypocladium paradoxum]|uniref:Uncharacterized protein n=1 Tax=Tolypocladium paradoxum TaxID=94208 RepID=A0A2S4KLB1_9HYPO|nr:hypothetical protein TPAR_08750 [Tolypocladium paradoxum]
MRQTLKEPLGANEVHMSSCLPAGSMWKSNTELQPGAIYWDNFPLHFWFSLHWIHSRCASGESQGAVMSSDGGSDCSMYMLLRLMFDSRL